MSYHVEISSPVDRVRALDLDERELRHDLLEAWVVGLPFEFRGQRWDPRESRLTVLAGPAAAGDDEEGWESVLRAAEDVTRPMLEAAEASAPSQRAVVVEADSAEAALEQLRHGGASQQISLVAAVERIERRDPEIATVILVVKRSPLGWPRS
jgi:hypothetical protein